MNKIGTMKFCVVFFVTIWMEVTSLDIFHEPWKTVFVPDKEAEYFGYSVLFSEGDGLVVGAPKAASKIYSSNKTGLLFSCKLDDLNDTSIKCSDLFTLPPNSNFFKHDMWLGATLAEISKGIYVSCAPRWTVPYKTTHLLAHGACLLKYEQKGGNTNLKGLTPFYMNNRLAFVADGSRKEYGEYGTHLNFYAYAQGGMSFKVTGNNSMLIGAPGLLQWTGGIAEYKYDIIDQTVNVLKLQPVSNPYFTKELGPDEYLGYSVESGIFDRSGKTLFVASGPRSRDGYGLVLIFDPATRSDEKLNIRIRLIGSQLGSYFGATLSCVDVNGDGALDLLVGAPNYVTTDGRMTFDEGAVFVFLNKQLSSITGFVLEDSGYISGSGVSGARFGGAISELGDINDDGYTDIAVGAAWEVHPDKTAGIGAVYIFKGGPNGITEKYIQRIAAKSAYGFGISITKGVDVDNNNCNDLAIGAFKSEEVYLYRCVPTIRVRVGIKVPNAMDLPQNATNFTALFCISSPAHRAWPHVKIDLDATIMVDPDGDRAGISGDSTFNTTISPGINICDEQVVLVKKTADLSKPIQLIFKLKEKQNQKDGSQKFRRDAARLSEDSELQASFDIQLTRDCGVDMICRPDLHFNMTPLADSYIPGTKTKLGISINIFNKEEPAFGVKVYMNLPIQPKRVPGECSLVDFNMTCNVPSPLPRGGAVSWEIELEDNLKINYRKELNVTAVLIEPYDQSRRKFESTLFVTPKVTFGVNGKATPNKTITISRDTFNNNENITFMHNFQITNYGPSDWYYLLVNIQIPDMVNLTNPYEICDDEIIPQCIRTNVPANTTIPVLLPFVFDLKEYGNILEELSRMNFTSTVIIGDHNLNASVTTVLVLEPAPPIWPVIVGVVTGLLLLSGIISGLYKYGFFTRQRFQQPDEDESVGDDGSEHLEDPGPSGSTDRIITEDCHTSNELISLDP